MTPRPADAESFHRVADEVSDLLNETRQIFRIVSAIHCLEGNGEQIQVCKRGQARLLPDRHRIIEQAFNQLGYFSRRDTGKPCDLRAQPGTVRGFVKSERAFWQTSWSSSKDFSSANSTMRLRPSRVVTARIAKGV